MRIVARENSFCMADGFVLGKIGQPKLESNWDVGEYRPRPLPFLHELLHHLRRDTRAAEPTIVVEVLHGHIAGQVAEERDAVMRAIDRRRVTQRAHLLCEAEKAAKALDPAAGGGHR